MSLRNFVRITTCKKKKIAPESAGVRDWLLGPSRTQPPSLRQKRQLFVCSPLSSIHYIYLFIYLFRPLVLSFPFLDGSKNRKKDACVAAVCDASPSPLPSSISSSGLRGGTGHSYPTLFTHDFSGRARWDLKTYPNPIEKTRKVGAPPFFTRNLS
jgi:hypothetical protein